MRFDDLNEDVTKLKVKLNEDNRHHVNNQKFTNVFFNLTDAIVHYSKQLMTKIVIGKMLGVL